MNSVFKALSDPTRREILKLLRNKDMSAGEISASFNISNASISHHLSILKQAELVSSEREGQNIIYSLNTTIFQEVVEWFFELSQRGDRDENKNK